MYCYFVGGIMVRVLGIDPGSRLTGYGVIDITGGKVSYVTSGIIRLPKVALPQRLKIIFDGVSEIIVQYEPHSMGIEEVFFAKDPSAALKLGQARGAALVAAGNADLTIGEYAAKSVKLAVVGTGSANKQQVQMMVSSLLGLSSAPSEDAADALAVAICHAHSMQLGNNTGGFSSGYARGRRQ
jgi:crossover junction endodeoxyribonuclease RuvC